MFPHVELSINLVIILSLSAFGAGFVDSVGGGGGLIQVPALLINFPKVSIPILFGTNKIAALLGTATSAYRYTKRVKIDWLFFLPVMAVAFIASYLGAKIVSYMDMEFLRVLVLVLLIVIAIYTYIKKDFGNGSNKNYGLKKRVALGSLIGLLVGFYDGFFGPGTGSFLMVGFVIVLGVEFIEASAYSKLINCTSNIAALFVFLYQKDIIISVAIILAVFNISGNLVGSHLALKKGNGFIRLIFLGIIIVMIVKYTHSILGRGVML